MIKCTSRWGHRFEARYSNPAPDLSRFTKLNGPGVVDFIEAMKGEVYERDICVRCGQTVEKAK